MTRFLAGARIPPVFDSAPEKSCNAAWLPAHSPRGAAKIYSWGVFKEQNGLDHPLGPWLPAEQTISATVIHKARAHGDGHMWIKKGTVLVDNPSATGDYMQYSHPIDGGRYLLKGSWHDVP